jgi:hypothetical protein
LVNGLLGPPPPENGITINTAGDVGIGRSVLFGFQARQMLNLYGAGFGIGVQTANLYYRSGAGFAWHVGGQHSDATYDPGAGGTTLMTLDDQGLKFGGRLGQQLWLWSDPGATRFFGIGIQDSTLYNRCGGGGADGFAWYKGGIHDNAYHNGGGGQLLMTLDSSGLSVATLTIRGGADLAEPFELSKKDIAKGSVVIIDSENEGKLRLSEQSYDQRVAGVVSGANGVNPGISLRQEGVLDGGQNVALSGRVYVLADATHGAIKPGDLLTTSDTPGHAMKVGDHSKAQGAILGKAMSGLKEGKGLVLVLVTLQ